MKMGSDVHQRVGTPHMKMGSDVHCRVGTPHMKMCSDVHCRVGTPHKKMCSDVRTWVGTPHRIQKHVCAAGRWVGGWVVVYQDNNATPWLHLAS